MTAGRLVYDASVAAAGLLFFLMGRRALRANAFDEALMSRVVIVGLAGAWIGARLAHVLDRAGFSGLGDGELAAGGASYLGGFLLAFAVLALAVAPRGRRLALFDALSVPLALAYAVGRVGCHLAADGCYGQPTSLPWGVHYEWGLRPSGVRVHPTPLYEAVASGALALGLSCRTLRRSPAGARLAVFLFGSGVARFAVEFVRRNERHGEWTQAQWLSSALVLVALVLLARLARGRGERPETPRLRTNPQRRSRDEATGTVEFLRLSGANSVAGKPRSR